MRFIDEFKQGTNPYGIPYKDMTKGKYVVVDIPFPNGKHVEVEGVISADLWCAHSCGIVYSQIKVKKQNTHLDTIEISKDLHAIYPEKVKKIIC